MDQKSRFVSIIKAHEGIILKVVSFYTNDRDDRADLYQETVYQLWKSMDSFKGASKPGTWIYRVALNTAICHLKKSKRGIRTIPLDPEVLELPDSDDTAAQERIKTLYAQIQQLNLLEKGIVLLYLEGRSYEEIAAIVGLTVTNVATKLSRVREKLKSQINKTA
ncbi:RNA polymerase sigma factor [Hufsiella ginkgonis]|uniref:Sigma-70 family RNA polymerase sigma factor n=1 Tax=Hufsiella ginkgonis TaxID=2695274 RepID=A0A7K1XZQ1_9SPHI|nr:sigma-70 family RNA polymerase sigma factor [Hufsiella ginkgonis]MXV16494.1 sigma-70 family RNA polymerase sigma factor [Hufsiella ginkgonis]